MSCFVETLFSALQTYVQHHLQLFSNLIVGSSRSVASVHSWTVNVSLWYENAMEYDDDDDGGDDDDDNDDDDSESDDDYDGFAILVKEIYVLGKSQVVVPHY